MSKLMYFNDEARNGLKNGIDKIANAVKISYGARGRLVGISQPYGAPVLTKDGATIAKEVVLDDPLENEGCKMVVEALNRILREAGDGTTQGTILTQALVTEGLKSVTAGCNPKDLKKGIDLAVAHIISNLKLLSQPVKGEYIKNVATISANNDDEIGTLIYAAISKVGYEGLVSMEDSSSENTHVEFSEGLQIESSLMSPYFITNPQTLESEQFNPLILLCDCKITNFNEIIPILEIAVEEKRELFIIAEDIDPTVLVALVNNRRQSGGLRVTTATAPGFGETRSNLLGDIAVVVNATVISADLDMKLKDVTVDMLGTADKVLCHREYTKFLGGKGDSKNIKERVSKIRAAIKVEKEEHIKKKLKTRLSKLSGGSAVIFVGAPTPTEQTEKKHRIEDSLEAVKAAISEGVVPGGCTALLRCAVGLNELPYNNEDERIGINIVAKAIEAPIKQILTNANVDVSMIMSKVKEGVNDFGFNIKTDQYENLFETGIIDPTKVIRVALTYSASVASMLLMLDCMIIEKQNNTQEPITNTGGLF